MGHAIITGGSSGIGLAIAKRLAGRGDDLSLIARDRARLEAAQREIDGCRTDGRGSTGCFAADVGRPEAASAAISQAVASAGPPEMLITAAGIAVPGYFTELSAETFERQMAVNYFGTLYCIRASVPVMQSAGRGKIVLISSGAGLMGIFGYSAYGPSKFAVRGLAETLRAELKPHGIGVSIAYPPDTDTPQLAEEAATKPPETKAITGAAKVWSADEVAREICEGVAKERFVIAPGWEMTWLARLHSLMRPALQWHFDRLAARATAATGRVRP